MPNKFKKGDIVRLKSGGPDMTVDDVVSGMLHCTWFGGTKLENAFFSEESLIEAPKSAAGGR